MTARKKRDTVFLLSETVEKVLSDVGDHSDTGFVLAVDGLEKKK